MKRDFGPSVLLPQVAHAMLVGMLQRHGNHVSPQHALALEQLMDGFTKQGLGITPGRRAYALPCGSGKTLSVVAWIAAQHKLGLGLSVAVSAQQIKSLCDIKDALIVEGVPPGLIGIRHSMCAGSVGWPDTGEEDRLIMLGSHSRIQRSDEMPSFCRHKGQPRDLLIWDESLISSDTRIVEVHDADRALSYFCADDRRPLLREIHERFLAKTAEELVKQQAGSEPSVFVLITDEELKVAMAELGGPVRGELAWASLRKAQEALRQFSRSMSVLSVGGGGGSGLVLMSYRIVVDPVLENIAVLDASYVVSELCKADPTIRNATTAAMLEYKNYSDVLVKQTTAPSGRWQFGRKAEAALALDAAVTSICEIPMDEDILVVTYRPKDGVDLERDLKRALMNRGIDSDELRAGNRRISFTTWGKHTTDNSFSGSRHVVCLGVVRQSSASVAAFMAGQKDNAAYRMTPERLSEVELSLLASNIMQAMSRGNCRRVDAEGKALPMTLHLITKEKGLQALLQKAMPGLRWETIDAKRPTRTEDAARRIAEHLLGLPEGDNKVSKRSIFSALDLQLASAAKAEAMARAMVMLALKTLAGGHRWVVVGQSLERRPRSVNALVVPIDLYGDGEAFAAPDIGTQG